MIAAKRHSRFPNRAAWYTALLLATPNGPAILGQRGLLLGQVIPELKLNDLGGRQRTLADYSGRVTLLVFWEPDHPRSVAAVCEVAGLVRKYESAGLACIASGPSARDAERTLAACQIKPEVLMDTDRAAFGAFQIVALPTALIVAPDRKLLFKTAGFNSSGMGAIESKLDDIYGRTRPVVAAPSGDPEALRRYGMAQQLLKAGMRGQAVKALEDLTVRHPDFRPAWVALAYCRIREDRPDDARYAFDKARALDSRVNDVAAGMAWLTAKKGDSGEAAKWAGMAPESDPHYDLVRELRKQKEEGGPR